MIDGKRQFDAEVAVTIDCEFSEVTPFKTVVGVGGHETVFTNADLFRLLARYELLSRDPEQTRLSDDQLNGLMQEANELFAHAEYLLGADVLEVLLDGRVKIALLIDSDGGDMEVHNQLDRALSYWKKGGGESQAYVYGHAHSAGFDTFMKADHRYVLDKSDLVWHFSDSDGERRQSVEGLRKMSRIFQRNQQELAELKQFFELSPEFDEDVWNDTIAEMVAEDNPEGELMFSGKEMHCWKLAKSFGRLKTLFARFRSEFVLADSLSVRDFWILSEVLNAEVRNTSDWQLIDFEKLRLHHAGGMLFQQKRHYWCHRLKKRERLKSSTA